MINYNTYFLIAFTKFNIDFMLIFLYNIVNSFLLFVDYFFNRQKKFLGGTL